MKTCIVDLFLTYFTPNPPDLLLTYFNHLGGLGPLACLQFHNKTCARGTPGGSQNICAKDVRGHQNFCGDCATFVWGVPLHNSCRIFRGAAENVSAQICWSPLQAENQCGKLCFFVVKNLGVGGMLTILGVNLGVNFLGGCLKPWKIGRS